MSSRDARGARTGARTGAVRRVGAWRAELCDCCDDPQLCCAVCWCGCSATGQLYQRATGRGCFGIAALLWILFALSQVLSQVSSQFDAAWRRDAHAGASPWATPALTFGALAGAVGLASLAVSTALVGFVRRRMRARDKIAAACGCEDCCVAYWCNCCALIQMLRQEGVDGNRYAACSEDGGVV